MGDLQWVRLSARSSVSSNLGHKRKPSDFVNNLVPTEAKEIRKTKKKHFLTVQRNQIKL